MGPGQVAYGVVPPFFGGQPLRDVTRRLPELDRLGVDALWLSPIQGTDDSSAISYATTDYCSIRPDFGDPEDLKELVGEAHERGMKVFLDIAPNHVSAGHPFYQDVLARGTASPYYNFFDRDENGEVTHYFDWNSLLNLNYADPRVREMVSGAFEHWVKEYDVDGFRVDAAWGVKERSPDFWPQLNERLEKVKPGLFMLAEASAKDPYYLASGFDAAYDWSEQLGKWAWDGVFDQPGQTGRKLVGVLGPNPDRNVARFLNNNDTGERFVTRYGPDLTRVAATLMLTLPGLPVIYNGDEVGASFLPYEDPPPLDWSDPHGLQEHYARLAELREALPSLAQGDFRTVPVEGNEGAYAFLRQAPGAKPVLVVLNFGDNPEVGLKLPAELQAHCWSDALTSQPVGPAGSLAMPGCTSYVLV